MLEKRLAFGHQVQVHLFTLFNYNTTRIKDKKEVKNKADDINNIKNRQCTGTRPLTETLLSMTIPILFSFYST